MAGALITYGADYDALFRRAAAQVDRVLKGATPANLPVEQPSRYELVLNFRTASTLGLTLPGSLLLDASEVIR